MVHKFFDKKIRSGVRATVNEVLVQELHKPVIKNFKRKEVCSWFKYSIMAADTAEMGLLSS